jgi:hypothetical protein
MSETEKSPMRAAFEAYFINPYEREDESYWEDWQAAWKAAQLASLGDQPLLMAEVNKTLIRMTERIAELEKQLAAPAPKEMRLCESVHLGLHPGVPYVFTVDSHCTACRELAAPYAAPQGEGK